MTVLNLRYDYDDVRIFTRCLTPEFLKGRMSVNVNPNASFSLSAGMLKSPTLYRQSVLIQIEKICKFLDKVKVVFIQ